MRYKGSVLSATAPATTTSYGVWTLQQQMQATGNGVWPTTPGAPTSVSATAGSSSAIVTFVAPSSAGYPAPITGYQATSTPGSFVATGSASPLTVTGLTNGTSYTIAVQALNASGYGAAGTSNSVTPINPYFLGILLPASGDYYLQSNAAVAATSTGFFVSGGDTSGGRIQKINNSKTIAFQNFVTVSGSSTYFVTVTVPSSGNIYVGGYNDGSSGGPWITKMDSGGSVTWSTGTPYLAYISVAITTDTSENVYYVGNKNTGDYDSANRIAIASLTSSGSNRWNTHFGSGQSFQAAGVSTYSTSVYVTGTVYQTGIYQSAGVLIKVAQSNGALEFEKKYSDDTNFWSLAQSASTGNCYIGATSNTGRSSVIKTDSSGTKQWSDNINVGYTNTKVAIDSSENLYSLRRGNINSKTLVICKHNSSGTIQWQRNLTLAYDITGGQSIAVTADGKIFVATQMQQTGPTQYYPFIALLNSDGSGTGTYTLNGQTYTYTASSYTTSSDSGSFAASTYGITSQGRSVNSLTTSSATDNLSLITT